jgi:phage baseplate assembly protein gpV
MTPSRFIPITVLGALGVLVFAGVGGAHSAAPPQPLVAQVGTPDVPEAQRIVLNDANGNRVSHVDPGTYTITVHDYATTHDFHLRGPGVDEASDIEGTTTTQQWTVTFVDGATYTYICDAHPLTMKGSFTSGTVVTPPPKPKVKKLNARIGPGKKISLTTTSGAKVKRLTAGKYRITVRDKSKSDNFHLLGKGVNKKTSVRGTGTFTWTVSLRKGAGSYRSDATKRLAGKFSVAG